MPSQPPRQWETGTIFPAAKRPRGQVNSSPPFTTKVMNEWSYTSTAPVCRRGTEGEHIYCIFHLQNYSPHSLSSLSLKEAIGPKYNVTCFVWVRNLLAYCEEKHVRIKIRMSFCRSKGRFTHSMPRPCRSPAMPCC